MTGQQLDTYPPSYCSTCNRMTAYDGWSYGELTGYYVNFYCATCGEVKARSPIDDISDPVLLQEIQRLFEDAAEDDEETPITERSLAEAGGSGPLTEEEPMPEKPIIPSSIEAPVGAPEGLCPRGCGPMRIIYRAVVENDNHQLEELKEVRCLICTYGEIR